MSSTTIGTIKAITVLALSLLGLWGLLATIMPINPFGDDELRIVYNLKMKSPSALWGQLEFMQEFPRVYLQFIKLFTAACGYGYQSLRFPSFFFGISVMIFSWRLQNRMYSSHDPNRYLFVLIIVSSYTFTQYFTQVKQYTMELLLSVVGIWQIMELAAIYAGESFRKAKYIYLCLSFLVAPYFSYTYPIVVVPVFVICLGFSARLFRQPVVLFRLWLPLALTSLSTMIFYFIDVARLMSDQNMRRFWGHLMYVRGFEWKVFFLNLYRLFEQVGAGLVFGIFFVVFGWLGLLMGLRDLFRKNHDRTFVESVLIAYATILLLTVIALNLARKLPMGEPRLNCFTVPAVAILVLGVFSCWLKAGRSVGLARFFSGLLYVGVIGNLFTTFIAYYTHPMYNKRMKIYHSTQLAVKLAQQKRTPLLVTAGVAFPYDTAWNMPYLTTVPGDWVLKTFPAYDVVLGLPVYPIYATDKLDSTISLLPAGPLAVMVGDGISYHMVDVRSSVRH